MKLIRQTLFFLSIAGLPLILEAKQVELIFNQTVQQEYSLDTIIDDEILRSPTALSSSDYCQRLKIENQKDQIIKGLLPFNQQQSFYTLEQLALQFAQEENPLLALYNFWIEAVQVSEDPLLSSINDPLYIINFVGACHREHYLAAFAKLCTRLGLSIRPVSPYDQDGYDVSYESDWTFLNPLSRQIYLSLDNESLVSSEQLMDDPFLALRTKSDRYNDQLHFKKAWEIIAHLQIAHPCSAEETSGEGIHLEKASIGSFELYPQEKLFYVKNHQREDLSAHQVLVKHLINAAERLQECRMTYTSPFPIQEICNQTSSTFYVRGQQILPNETIKFEDSFPFLIEMTTDNATCEGALIAYSVCSNRLFPKLYRGKNQICLGKEIAPADIRLTYDLNDAWENIQPASVQVSNQESVFDFCSPSFQLKSNGDHSIEKIWWQISPKSDFSLVPANFEQVESFKSAVSLPTISETFLNNHEKYYFRVKAYNQGTWGAWSETFAFSVNKPGVIGFVEFDKIEEQQYEITWERVEANSNKGEVEYLIFGSNSLDFIPSIYTDKHINAIINGEVVEEEPNQNLVAITSDPRYVVDGSSLAYYRIVAKQGELFSIPSDLIRIYDCALTQQRDILQMVKVDPNQTIMQRISFPSSYSYLDIETLQESSMSEELFPYLSYKKTKWKDALVQIHSMWELERSEVKTYPHNPHVSDAVWERVKPYLLPENHPAKPVLDRMFSTKRITLSSESFRAAGFKNNRVRPRSRAMISSHPQLKHYFIKAFPDTEINIRNDWQRWIHRIEGAKAIRKYIVQHGYEKNFKVPHKWLYTLPSEPSPPRSAKFLRKNFILVAENARPLEHVKNEKKFKKMPHKVMYQLFHMIRDLGLWDSVFAFNIPYCQDGKIAFIDTEDHHRWPIRFFKLSRYFSDKNRSYWEELIKKYGVDRPTPHAIEIEAVPAA